MKVVDAESRDEIVQAIGQWIIQPTHEHLAVSTALAGALSRPVWTAVLREVIKVHGIFEVVRWISEAADRLGRPVGSA